MSSKDALIIDTLEELMKLTEALAAQSLGMHDFLSDSFKHYNRHAYTNPYPLISSVRKNIDALKQITRTNADNKHLLSKEQEEKKEEQPRGYRMSPYVTSYMMPSDGIVAKTYTDYAQIIGPPARPYSLEHRDLDPDTDF